MGTTRTTIRITGQQDAWSNARTEAGDFTDDSEHIQDLVRRDQARQAEHEAIRVELIKGEESGAPRPLAADAFKETMTANHARRAR